MTLRTRVLPVGLGVLLGVAYVLTRHSGSRPGPASVAEPPPVMPMHFEVVNGQLHMLSQAQPKPQLDEQAAPGRLVPTPACALLSGSVRACARRILRASLPRRDQEHDQKQERRQQERKQGTRYVKTKAQLLEQLRNSAALKAALRAQSQPEPKPAEPAAAQPPAMTPAAAALSETAPPELSPAQLTADERQQPPNNSRQLSAATQQAADASQEALDSAHVPSTFQRFLDDTLGEAAQPGTQSQPLVLTIADVGGVTGLLPQFAASLRQASPALSDQLVVICISRQAHAACLQSPARCLPPDSLPVAACCRSLFASLQLAWLAACLPAACCPSSQPPCGRPALHSRTGSWSSASRARRMPHACRAQPGAESALCSWIFKVSQLCSSS